MSDIVYIPTSTDDVAQRLSDALWGLALPSQLRGDNVSQKLFGVVLDAAGQSWLEVDTERTIPVHAVAVIDGIAGILLGAGIPQADVDALEALIIAQRGQTLCPYHYFPDVFKAQARTFEQITWHSRPV